MEDTEFKKATEFIQECMKETKSTDQSLFKFDEQDWNLYYVKNTKITENFGNFRIIEKIFNTNNNCESKDYKYNKHKCELDSKCTWNDGCFYKDGSAAAKYETLPNLVVMAGFSTKSFCNTTKVIMQKLDSLKKCYRAVYVICLDNLKKIQGDYCDYRDSEIKREPTDEEKRKNPELENIYSDSYRSWRNDRELETNQKIANIIDKILRNLNLKNVHILGKCAGGLVAINAISKSDIYTGLLLAVPGSPLNVKELENISTDKLKKMKFRFQWNQDDDFSFDWNKMEHKFEKLKNSDVILRASRDEKLKYDERIKEIEKNKGIKLDYKSYLFPVGGHEVHQDLFEALCN
jgi:hypothetical protein